mmetsp:Transcript_86644/g.223160  ORF Transcript_86644/g.223160 Transcript_86644/m.223160 type:complete len:261 (-) Transcript_86644:396-1178(-)
MRLRLLRWPPDLLGRAQDVRGCGRVPPHRRREGAEDARWRLAGVDAGGGPDEVPRRHGARHDPVVQQEAEEGCGGGWLVRLGGARRLWPALRPSLRREAQPVPKQVLPHGRRLVCQGVDRRPEGADAADALLPLLPQRRLLEPDACRRLLPLPPGRPARHLGLLLPNERGVAVAEGLGLRADLHQRAGAGLVRCRRRRRRCHHADAALRRPRPARAQREEPHRPGLRQGDEAREEPGADQEAVRWSQEGEGRQGPGGHHD